MKLDFGCGGGATKPDGSYLTIYGYSFSNDGITYGMCDRTVALALMNRYLNCRPGGNAREVQLRNNQRKFVTESRGFLKQIREHLEPHFTTYADKTVEAEVHHGDPHPKKALRVAGWLEGLESGMSSTRTWVGKVNGKLKRAETAKGGAQGGLKAPRIIVDMGVLASLCGFRITEYFKNGLDGHLFECEGGHMEFCKTPNPARLRDVFARLIDPPGRYYFVAFSDDSCYSVRHGGEILMYNLDISKNDVSHEWTFDALIAATPKHAQRDMKDLCDQGLAPLRIRSCVDPRRCTTLKPLTRKMYSGATITTAINSLASFLIARALALDAAATPAEIETAAEKVGFLITTDRARSYHQLQFLKHSPVFDVAGTLRPIINVGVILRASGQCKRDLPGRATTPLAERARTFQAALLNGLVPRAHYSLIDAMKRAARGPITDDAIKRVQHDILDHRFEGHNEEEEYTVDDDEVFRRYDLTRDEISELVEVAGKLGYAQCYAGGAVSKILEKDYGLSSLSDLRSGELLESQP